MKLIKIFKKGHRELYTGLETWVVEWTSRYGRYSDDTEKHYQAFTNEDEAEAFAEEIRRAHKLIGNTHYDETRVTVKKHRNGL